MSLRRDLRQALRSWRQSPLFWCAAAGTLALGVGVTTTVFSVLDAAVLRPLPLPDSHQLVKLIQVEKESGARYGVPFHSFHHWRAQSRSFQSMAALRHEPRQLRQGEGARRVLTAEVTEDFFRVLGAEPAKGQLFSSFRGPHEGERPAVVSHQLWQSHFGGAEDAVGRELILDGEAYRVTGILPSTFPRDEIGGGDLWTPIQVDVAAALQQPVWGFNVLGRLADGATAESAQMELDGIALGLEEVWPELGEGWGVELIPLRTWVAGGAEPALLAVFAAAFAILLVAGANVASLSLGRLLRKRSDLSTRAALGADRWKLLRPLLVEGALLAAAGCAGGAALAFGGIRALRAMAPEQLPRLEEAALDGRVLAVAAAGSLLVGLLALVLPALRLVRRDVFLRTGRRGSTAGRRAGAVQGALVAGQVALAFVVAVGAGLVARSQDHLQQVDVGFQPQGLLVASLQGEELAPSSSPEERIARFQQLLARVAALPQVESAALSAQPLPLGEGQGVFNVYPPEAPRDPGEEMRVFAATVSPGYFQTLGIPLLRGRAFQAEDSWERTQAVVVNQALARRFWPEQDPIGREIRFAGRDPRPGRVVGVVGDTRQVALRRPAQEQIYVPWGSASARQHLVVRGAEAAQLLPLLRTTAWEETRAVLFGETTGQKMVAAALARHRFFTGLLRAAAVLALVLGMVGVYGVVAAGVGRRTREIGIRLALGSTPLGVVRLVVLRGLVPVALGLAVGLGGAGFVGRGLEELLYETRPLEPAAFGAALGVLALAALAACLLPARRAARVDPVRVLQAD